MDIKAALNGTGIASVIKAVATKEAVTAYYRVRPTDLDPWIMILGKVMATQELAPASMHMCKQYVYKDGEVLHVWHLSVKWPKCPGDLEQLLISAFKLARETTTQLAGELESYPLNASPNRNTPGGSIDFSAPGLKTGGGSHKGAVRLGTNEK